MRAWWLSLAVATSVLSPAAALAWGDSGHRMIGRLGAESLPDELPGFLRTPDAAQDVGELAREPDRSRNAGKIHDTDRDPAHFVDVDDNGKVLGGPALEALPPTREDYDTALRAAGADAVKAGWLPYAIVDGYQQLEKDFALWRLAAAGERLEKDPVRRAWIAADRRRRERLIVRDLGVWAHFVGDATQPMHISVHYNGWGEGPNPHGYSTERLHVSWEGAYVSLNVREADVRSRLKPYGGCRCPIEPRVAQYLKASWGQVIPFYELEKAGGFKPSDPRGVAFAADRLAEAASELRDLAVDAWRSSALMSVGYPAARIEDVEAGRADAYDLLHGMDP